MICPKIVVFSTLLYLPTGVTLAGDGKILYDQEWRPKYRVEEDGRIYDKDWQLKGRMGEDGRLYDETGRLKSNITPEGRVFDQAGKIKERVQPDVRMYSPELRAKGLLGGKPGKK